jgi:uncharacterized protein (TIGR00730 family)
VPDLPKTRTIEPIRSIAVYCGSSSGSDSAFVEAAKATGYELADRGIELIYGGGKVGLMGAVADAVLERGGTVRGVITSALLNAEVGHRGLTSLDVVESMHERKAKMADLADAFLGLPGGFGTFDELFEVLTWTQLGIQSKPVAVVNVLGYWDFVLRQAAHAASCGFIKPVHAELLRSGLTPGEAIDLLFSPVPLPVPKWADR